ncbi:MAG: helix-turn-helix domain-containing protein [Rhodobacteraceae bacterium]|nr:MAG: helix-turn-helix domain-containing protein [Paracoccaceae bacterium]
MKFPQFGAQADLQGGMPPEDQSRIVPPVHGQGKGLQVVRLRGIVMILELKRQGLGVSAIARQTGLDRKTVRKYLERGFEAPIYGPRVPGDRLAGRFRSYLSDRLEAFPGLLALRLHHQSHKNLYLLGSGRFPTITTANPP